MINSSIGLKSFPGWRWSDGLHGCLSRQRNSGDWARYAAWAAWCFALLHDCSCILKSSFVYAQNKGAHDRYTDRVFGIWGS